MKLKSRIFQEVMLSSPFLCAKGRIWKALQICGSLWVGAMFIVLWFYVAAVFLIYLMRTVTISFGWKNRKELKFYKHLLYSWIIGFFWGVVIFYLCNMNFTIFTRVYNSLVFSIFSVLWNFHHHLITEYFHHSKKKQRTWTLPLKLF